MGRESQEREERGEGVRGQRMREEDDWKRRLQERNEKGEGVRGQMMREGMIGRGDCKRDGKGAKKRAGRSREREREKRNELRAGEVMEGKRW